MADRDLARAKALDADLVLQRVEARRQALSSSVAGTTTLNSRFSPSTRVSVTCIAFTRPRSTRRARRRAGTSISRPRSRPPGVVCPPRPGMQVRRWCGRRDLNPHDFRHGNLNPARLPISPRPPGRPWAAPAKAPPLYHRTWRGQSGNPPRPTGGYEAPAYDRCPASLAKIAGMTSGKSSAMTPRPTWAAGCPVHPDRRRGGLESRHLLGQQTADEPGEHVACPGRREFRRGVVGDRRPSVRAPRPPCPAPLRTTTAPDRRRRLPGPVELRRQAGEIGKEAHELAIVGREDRRRRPTARICANSRSAIVGEGRQPVGIDHRGGLGSERRRRPAPRSRRRRRAPDRARRHSAGGRRGSRRGLPPHPCAAA